MLLVGLGGTAAAQVGQPRNLLPTSPGDEGTPETAPPAPDTSAPPEPGTTAAPKGFEINALDELGTDYAGPLEASKGGFAIDMWRGTDRVRVERLLPLLKPTTSPALADLTRRLLLSNAGAPAGKGSGGSLFPLRARLLSDMGLAPDALALLKLQRPEQRDAPTARLLAELSWRTGDLDGGCAAITDALPKVKVDSFWQEATIFCQLHAGQADQASLGLDVLREQGDESPAFFALADALGGNAKAQIPPLATVTPLYLAMAQAAHLPAPKVVVRTPPPLMLALLAEAGDVDLDSRLADAETAAAAGVLSTSQLAAAYNAKPADAGQLAGVLDRTDIGRTPESRALLYQAAQQATAPPARARLIQKALETDSLDGAYWARLQLYLPLLADLPSTPDLVSFAPAAARHLYAGGRLREAAAWVGLLQQNQAQDKDAAAALPALLALDHLAGGDAPPPALDTLPTLAATGASARGARPESLRAIFAAIDPPPPAPAGDAEATIAPATQVTAMPEQNLNLWLDLGDAAAKGRVGETVLLSLAGLDAGGIDGAEPLWLGRAIASLRQVGLEQDARRLAVEAAVVNGL